MKKLFIFTTVILTFVLGVFSVSADTLFVNGDYKFSTSNDQIKILEYLGNDADVVIPEEILGDTVVGIGHMAFSYNDSIKTIIIPSSVTKIDGYAMSYINNLESVVISENCIDLGVGVFQVCPSLKNVEIKSNITSISAQTFYSCTSLESFVVPSTVESIDKNAFTNCTALTSITIPKATTTIASNSFSNCPNLTIYGYADSYAQQYATENNIPFVAISEYELGDVDLNGRVDVKDATDIQRYAAELATFNETQISVADMNNDGVINVADATDIQKYIVRS